MCMSIHYAVYIFVYLSDLLRACISHVYFDIVCECFVCSARLTSNVMFLKIALEIRIVTLIKCYSILLYVRKV